MNTTQMPFLCTLAVSLLLLVEGSRPGCMPAAAADVVSVRQLQQVLGSGLRLEGARLRTVARDGVLAGAWLQKRR